MQRQSLRYRSEEKTKHGEKMKIKKQMEKNPNQTKKNAIKKLEVKPRPRSCNLKASNDIYIRDILYYTCIYLLRNKLVQFCVIFSEVTYHARH